MACVFQFISFILIIFHSPKARFWQLRLRWNAYENEATKPCYLITEKLPYILINRRIQPVPIFHREDPYPSADWWCESLSLFAFASGAG